MQKPKKVPTTLVLTVLATCFSIPLFSACSISPQTEAQISPEHDVDTGVLVGGNSLGFLAVWGNDSREAKSSFSLDQGQTWGAPFTLGSLILSDLVFVTAQNTNFLTSWVFQGASLDHVRARFSNDGTTWGSIVAVHDASVLSVGSVVPSASNDAGFMLVWGKIWG